MGYDINYDNMEAVLAEMKKKYIIYAPKSIGSTGTMQKGMIRYGEINSIKDVVYDQVSDFSPKEVFYPVVQPLIYFREGTYIESELEIEKDILIFARPCDICGIERLDQIFLHNGGQADNYYQRYRKKVKFAMIECSVGWDTCFCVSMKTNKTDNYSIAVKFEENGLQVEVIEDTFEDYFLAEKQVDYKPEFVSVNTKTVHIPKIKGPAQVSQIIALDFWKQFDEKCIGCGGCNTVCISCSCFDTIDVIYNETSMEGERRRVWSSCMLKSFTIMAGGHGVRPTAGERMRFKTLHKIYDYKQRFDTLGHMCVGCGRCDKRCSKDIQFSEVIDGLYAEVEKLNAEAENREEKAYE